MSDDKKGPKLRAVEAVKETLERYYGRPVTILFESATQNEGYLEGHDVSGMIYSTRDGYRRFVPWHRVTSLHLGPVEK